MLKIGFRQLTDQKIWLARVDIPWPNSSNNAIRRRRCLRKIVNGWVSLSPKYGSEIAAPYHCYVTIKESAYQNDLPEGVVPMPVVIPDETLKQAGLSEKEALIEIACRLFDAGKLHLNQAARLAGITRYELESELMSREIDVYRIDEGYLQHELEMSGKTLEH